MSGLQVKYAEITFDQVSFSYDKKVPILRNISFTNYRVSQVNIYVHDRLVSQNNA